MATHNELGKAGEEHARAYLLALGYQIRHINWRYGQNELDLIAEHQGELIVVEVKTRTNGYQDPEMAITDKKIRSIVSATEGYINRFEIDLPVRFDVLAITQTGTIFYVNHIEDAFIPPIW